MMCTKSLTIAVIIFIVAAVTSCQSEHQKQREQYIKDSAEFVSIITEWIKSQDASIKIDRLSIDTIIHPTQSQDSLLKFIQITSAIDKIGNYLEEKGNHLSKNINKAKIFSDLGSNILYESAMNDVKTVQIDYKKHLDAMGAMNSRIRKIDSLMRNNLLDTIKKHGNMIQFSLIGSDSKNQEVKIDTTFIYITEDKHIRPLNIFKEYGLES